MTPSIPEIASLTFEQAMKELEAIVRRLESGQADLEHSIVDYERGMALKEHCQRKLADAKLKVEKIVKTADGTLATVAFDPENA